MPKALPDKDGFSFIIHLNDHEPSHVHVYKAGAYAQFYLGSKRKPPRLRKNIKMKRNEVRRALQLVCKHQKALLKKWRKIHA